MLRSGSKPDRSLGERLYGISLVALVLACALMAWAILTPIANVAEAGTAVSRRVAPLPTERIAIEPLLAKAATTELVRPGQVKAAVKDDGTAARMLKALKLQGVVQLNQSPVAYVQIEKQGVATVKKGDTILEFVVEGVEPGRVILSLNGVIVELAN